MYLLFLRSNGTPFAEKNNIEYLSCDFFSNQVQINIKKTIILFVFVHNRNVQITLNRHTDNICKKRRLSLRLNKV